MDRPAADTGDFSARLKYLHEAAHALALASPETSSFLGSQYSHLLAENDLVPPESQKREACGACGTVFVPGISCAVTQEQSRPLKKRNNKVQKPPSTQDSKCCKVKIYSCLRCSSKTRLPITSSKPRMGLRRHTKTSTTEAPIPAMAASRGTPAVEASAAAPAPVPAPAAAPIHAPAPAPPAAAAAVSNASSKKRAKARKGGLQALLASSKKDTSSSKGFGLDLMDFMRSD